MATPCLLLTSGEPAGIGPDLIVMLAQQQLASPYVVLACQQLLQTRAKQLQLPLQILAYRPGTMLSSPASPGTVWVWDKPLPSPCQPGILAPQHASYVVAMLQQANDLCLQQQFSALVTCPVHKGNINHAGIEFTGHTEFFATASQTPHVVMLLANARLRVALASTHLPLARVCDYLNASTVEKTLAVLHTSLQRYFAIEQPRIGVCGINPHAGEDGYLGNEEKNWLTPLIKRLQAQGMQVTGPLAADTAFISEQVKRFDALLAMYHDQGLPVVKALGFGDVVNVTLGLPYIRTSVDHGTALALAGTGQAQVSSLISACQLATRLAQEQHYAT
jgi:4-hydroxythreonine-4-phosphate dehydrogenase